LQPNKEDVKDRVLLAAVTSDGTRTGYDTGELCSASKDEELDKWVFVQRKKAKPKNEVTMSWV
jgi:hypothetical protein